VVYLLFFISRVVYLYITPHNHIRPVRKNKHKRDYFFVLFCFIIILRPAPTPANNVSRWNDKIITSHTRHTAQDVPTDPNHLPISRPFNIRVGTHTYTHICGTRYIMLSYACGFFLISFIIRRDCRLI